MHSQGDPRVPSLWRMMSCPLDEHSKPTHLCHQLYTLAEFNNLNQVQEKLTTLQLCFQIFIPPQRAQQVPLLLVVALPGRWPQG